VAAAILADRLDRETRAGEHTPGTILLTGPDFNQQPASRRQEGQRLLRKPLDDPNPSGPPSSASAGSWSRTPGSSPAMSFVGI